LSYNLVFICLAIFAVAVLYSSVGHAGASGYIATLTLFGLSPASIKPTALILNILVACIGTYQFWRAGHFSWNLFWPFAILSVPFAFLGGYLIIPAHVLRVIVGGVLLCSALRLFFARKEPENIHAPHLTAAIPVGAGIGFLSGITGTGGGIFLTPILLFFRWTHIKTAAAISALFILLNSLSAANSGHYVASRDHSDFWRDAGLLPRQPPSYLSPYSNGAGRSPDHRRIQADLYLVLIKQLPIHPLPIAQSLCLVAFPR